MEKYYFAKPTFYPKLALRTEEEDVLDIDENFLMAGESKISLAGMKYKLSGFTLLFGLYRSLAIKTGSGGVIWRLIGKPFGKSFLLYGPDHQAYKIKCVHKGMLTVAMTCTGPRGNVIFSGTQKLTGSGERGRFSLFKAGDEHLLALALMVQIARSVLRKRFVISTFFVAACGWLLISNLNRLFDLLVK